MQLEFLIGFPLQIRIALLELICRANRFNFWNNICKN